MVEGVDARGVVGGAVPEVGVADSDSGGSIVVEADREVQRVGAGTAVSVSIVVGVGA